MTWLGHSSVLIELDGVRLLTDPVLASRVGPLVRIAPPPPVADLDIDAVLISHLHVDHTHAWSLRRLGLPPVVGPSGSARWLRRRGMAEVDELAPGQEASVGGVTVTATPAVHGGGRWPFGSKSGSIGLVARGSQACYFAGDTDLYPDMARMRGSIDIALLPVWGWGSRLGPGHLDPRRAATAAGMILPRVAVPIHWGTLVMGWRSRAPADPARPAHRFKELAAQLAPTVDVRVLAPGQRTELHAGSVATRAEDERP